MASNEITILEKEKLNKPFHLQEGNTRPFPNHENTLCHPLLSPFVMVAKLCFNDDIVPLSFSYFI